MHFLLRMSFVSSGCWTLFASFIVRCISSTSDDAMSAEIAPITVDVGQFTYKPTNCHYRLIHSARAAPHDDFLQNFQFSRVIPTRTTCEFLIELQQLVSWFTEKFYAIRNNGNAIRKFLSHNRLFSHLCFMTTSRRSALSNAILFCMQLNFVIFVKTKMIQNVVHRSVALYTTASTWKWISHANRHLFAKKPISASRQQPFFF